MPIVGVYAVLIASLQIVFGLVPYAVNLLPLLLFVIDTPADATHSEYAFSASDARAVYASNTFDDASELPDGLVFLRTISVEAPPASFRRTLFAFEYGIPPHEIARAVSDELKGNVPESITVHLIDGASLFNDKFSFFSVLNSLKNRKITLKCFGILESTTALFNDSRGEP